MSDPNFGWTAEMQVKALRHGLRCAEVPVSYRRRVGVSKITGTVAGTLRAGYKILWTVLRYSKGKETEMTEPVRIETEIEVRYAETDQMGVVHHANYVVWFELARTRLCAPSGFHYADIEKMGYLLMVTGVEVSYRRPARYGDTVEVVCWIDRLGSRGPPLRLRGPQEGRGPGHRRHRAHLGRDGHRPAVPHAGTAAGAVPADWRG